MQGRNEVLVTSTDISSGWAVATGTSEGDRLTLSFDNGDTHDALISEDGHVFTFDNNGVWTRVPDLAGNWSVGGEVGIDVIQNETILLVTSKLRDGDWLTATGLVEGRRSCLTLDRPR